MTDLRPKFGLFSDCDSPMFSVDHDSAKKLLSLEGLRQRLVRNIVGGILDQLG